MKRVLLIFALIMLLLPAAPFAGRAAAVDVTDVCNSGNPSGTDASGTDVCQSVHGQEGNQGSDPIITIIKAGINILAIVIGGAAIIGLLACSIRMITAGDASSAAQARSGLIYSLVGIAIAVLAEAIVEFVLNNVS